MKKEIDKKSMNRFAKDFLGLLFFLIISITGFSQNVGINHFGVAISNLEVGLDVNFTNKGSLIPRVSLQNSTSSSPLTSHIAGMLAYNTATVGDVTPGYYYNNGTVWIAGFPKANAAGNIQYYNGTTWATIRAGSTRQLLQFNPSGLPSWANNSLQPIVVTKSIETVLSTSATCGGIVLNDAGSPITAYGVCWSTAANPTIANNITTDGTGIGSYTSTMIGLNTGTMYYFRAYVKTSNGTVYGTEYNFITL
jgi:hypothetical protein